MELVALGLPQPLLSARSFMLIRSLLINLNFLPYFVQFLKKLHRRLQPANGSVALLAHPGLMCSCPPGTATDDVGVSTPAHPLKSSFSDIVLCADYMTTWTGRLMRHSAYVQPGT